MLSNQGKRKTSIVLVFSLLKAFFYCPIGESKGMLNIDLSLPFLILQPRI
jgi:hypothetical protein